MAAADPTIHQDADLLTALHVDDLAAAGEQVDEENEVVTWIETAVNGIEVRRETVGTTLAFPFLLSDFWEVVRDTEGDQLRRWELNED